MTAPNHVFQVDISAPPETVWRAITEGELTRRYFFDTTVVSDWRPGSEVVYHSDTGERITEGTVLEVEPFRRLSYTWRALWDEDVAGEQPSRVTWELSPTDSGTRLVLVHDEFEEDSTLAEQVGGGWPGVLDRLKTMVESGLGVPSGGR